jgi:hypothetical protein
MLDAFGRRRSSRSIPTGQGSRGGTFYKPGTNAKYHRAWRRNHPEYRKREVERSLRRKREQRRIRDEDRLSFTDVLRQMTAEACVSVTQRAFGEQVAVDHNVINRFLRGGSIRSDTYDALLDHFKVWAVARRYGQLRLGRERANSGPQLRRNGSLPPSEPV